MEGIIMADGSSADIIKGRFCPWRQVSHMVTMDDGRTGVATSLQACMRSCALYDHKNNECAVLMIAQHLTKPVA